MLRRSALCACLTALPACYSGLPQGEAASDAATSTGSGGPPATTAITEAGPVSATDGSSATADTEPVTTEPVTTDSFTTDPLTGGSTGSFTTGSMTTGGETGEPGETGETGEPQDPVAQLCQRWKADRAQLGEGAWDGEVNACVAGTLAQDGRDNALRLVNLYRHIAGLPAVTEDPARTSKAQACALMMHANGQLSHSPPMNWKCWTADGASAAGASNISGTPGVLGVDLYMVDPGNDTTIGHRRWILSNYLGPIGLGSTSKNSCMLVIGGNGNAGKPWVAWPPPGLVPYQAVHVPTIGWSHVDQTGWTVQSDSIDLGGAGVTVTVDGAVRPVAVHVLGKNYGSSFAIRFVPQGWQVEPGKTYEVELSGVAQPISYSVQIVDCG